MARSIKNEKFPKKPAKVTGFTVDQLGSAVFPGSAAVTLPLGPEANRPATPGTGMIRINTDNNSLEYYNSIEWKTLSGTSGATSNATIVKDNFITTTGGTLYGPLSVTPYQVNAVLVYMDNVVQEPGYNFTLANSSGTLTGTLNYIKFDSPGTQNGKRLVVVQGFDTI
jgi:regulatory protein YycH of two-component signal transduction system YycFG